MIAAPPDKIADLRRAPRVAIGAYPWIPWRSDVPPYGAGAPRLFDAGQAGAANVAPIEALT